MSDYPVADFFSAPNSAQLAQATQEAMATTQQSHNGITHGHPSGEGVVMPMEATGLHQTIQTRRNSSGGGIICNRCKWINEGSYFCLRCGYVLDEGYFNAASFFETTTTMTTTTVTTIFSPPASYSAGAPPVSPRLERALNSVPPQEFITALPLPETALPHSDNNSDSLLSSVDTERFDEVVPPSAAPQDVYHAQHMSKDNDIAEDPSSLAPLPFPTAPTETMEPENPFKSPVIAVCNQTQSQQQKPLLPGGKAEAHSGDLEQTLHMLTYFMKQQTILIEALSFSTSLRENHEILATHFSTLGRILSSHLQSAAVADSLRTPLEEFSTKLLAFQNSPPLEPVSINISVETDAAMEPTPSNEFIPRLDTPAEIKESSIKHEHFPLVGGMAPSFGTLDLDYQRNFAEATPSFDMMPVKRHPTDHEAEGNIEPITEALSSIALQTESPKEITRAAVYVQVAPDCPQTEFSRAEAVDSEQQRESAQSTAVSSQDIPVAPFNLFDFPSAPVQYRVHSQNQIPEPTTTAAANSSSLPAAAVPEPIPAPSANVNVAMPQIPLASNLFDVPPSPQSPLDQTPINDFHATMSNFGAPLPSLSITPQAPLLFYPQPTISPVPPIPLPSFPQAAASPMASISLDPETAKVQKQHILTSTPTTIIRDEIKIHGPPVVNLSLDTIPEFPRAHDEASAGTSFAPLADSPESSISSQNPQNAPIPIPIPSSPALPVSSSNAPPPGFLPIPSAMYAPVISPDTTFPIIPPLLSPISNAPPPGFAPIPLISNTPIIPGIPTPTNLFVSSQVPSLPLPPQPILTAAEAESGHGAPDDLGFDNSSLSKSKPIGTTSSIGEEVNEEKGPTNSGPVSESVTKSATNPNSAGVLGLLTGWFGGKKPTTTVAGGESATDGTKSPASNGGKNPVKANLGQENTFYYDEKLGRWVDKSSQEDFASAPPLPPPPIMSSSPSPATTTPGAGPLVAGSVGAPPIPMMGMSQTAQMSARSAKSKYIDPFNH